MKLYTRTGDDGTTGLFSGARVSKDHPRIEAYGTVDELNSLLGVVMCSCDPAHPFEARLHAILSAMQSRLFDIGADLATPEGAKQQARIHRIDDADVAEAEGWIDEIDSANPPPPSSPRGCTWRAPSAGARSGRSSRSAASSRWAIRCCAT
jgi:cob(I)alamin adenosyltransferase